MGSKILIGIILIETLKFKITIGMGTTSYNKDDATHLTYTPLERENSKQSRFNN